MKETTIASFFVLEKGESLFSSPVANFLLLFTPFLGLNELNQLIYFKIEVKTGSSRIKKTRNAI